jgi:beta-glucanase (GH16 family)
MIRLKETLLADLLIPLAAGIAQAQGATGATLDLCGLKPTFTEDFNDLKVSAWKMGDNRWIAHTPWNGDFGDAAFTNPQPDFPFTVKDGVLRIEARKDANGKWRSGLLASADPWGAGFSQMYGYFEVRMKIPKGPGTWPAFWLGESYPVGTPPHISVEFDPIEFYGQFPDSFNSGYAIWDNVHHTHSGRGFVEKVPSGTLDADFHTFGIEVEKDFMTYYYDRNRYWQVPTPEEHKGPIFVMVNLALGSGWPIDKTPNPTFLEVDYVHVYERDPAACVK